jgi:superoxide dismutase, Fe-Mn family
MNRRELLLGAGSAIALSKTFGSSPALAQGKAAPPASVPYAKHAVLPLPFDPKKLKGLSERMLTSHHDNNYAGAIANLNKVEDELSRLPPAAPGYLVGGLRERELVFGNSAILHELYFGNLGGNGKPDGAVVRALGEGLGNDWEGAFRATGASLGGGSGWVILAYSLTWNALRIRWSGNHSQTMASGVPLLVMDMYEHAYQMDYGAAAARYIDAFFANVRWDEVNRRYERALAMARVA